MIYAHVLMLMYITSQGYFPAEYNIDCFKAYRTELDARSRELHCVLMKLNDMDLLNCDKDLKVMRRHLVRRIQVSKNHKLLLADFTIVHAANLNSCSFRY